MVPRGGNRIFSYPVEVTSFFAPSFYSVPINVPIAYIKSNQTRKFCMSTEQRNE